MACRGICPRYKAKWLAHEYRYAQGQKRCQVCNIFIVWDGNHCPCCGMSLRTRPRTSRYKERLLNVKSSTKNKKVILEHH